MIVFIDTNIIIDYLVERQPFYNEARQIMALCAENKINGYVAAHSITNVFYILRKFPKNEIRAMLVRICKILTVVGIDEAKIKAVLENLDFDDIEDCLQSVCAEECGAEYIITRNVKDFSGSKVPPVTPTDFLSNP